MKLQRKSLALFLSLVLVLLVVVGCSSNNNNGGTNDAANNGEKEWEVQTVRFSEVIRSIFYAPHYVALEKGFFEEEGLNVDLVTSQGSDKGAAALLAGTADISLIGPETTIYIHNQESSKKLKTFYQLTMTDGSFLMSREPVSEFKWADVEGKSVVGWRHGSAPGMVIDSVLKREGVKADVITNIAAPAMVGAFASGQGDYIQVFEPIASNLEAEGLAHFATSMGTAIGEFPETSFVATTDYIDGNKEVIERFVRALKKATDFTLNGDMDEVVAALAPYFEGTSNELIQKSVERYIAQDTWSMEPVMSENAFNVLQQVLIEAGELKEDQKVQMDDILDMSFVK